LLRQESDDVDAADAMTTAAERGCRKLCLRLAKVVTPAGCQSLLARAIHIAAVDAPFLQGVRAGVIPAASLEGVQEATRGVPTELAQAGLAAVLAHLLGLLATFIGDDLTARLVRDVWSDAPIGRGETDAAPREVTEAGGPGQVSITALPTGVPGLDEVLGGVTLAPRAEHLGRALDARARLRAGPGGGRLPRPRRRGGPGARRADHLKGEPRFRRRPPERARVLLGRLRTGRPAAWPSANRSGEAQLMASRVLVVDDDRAIRSLLRDLLVDDGHEVATAADGAEALDALRAFRADVILLDINMPVMDGITFVQRYRAGCAADDQVPIIVITAGGNAAARTRQLAAAGFVGKPFDLDEVSRAVAGVGLRAG
jgi:CheY-like chemotaxis protein